MLFLLLNYYLNQQMLISSLFYQYQIRQKRTMNKKNLHKFLRQLSSHNIAKLQDCQVEEMLASLQAKGQQIIKSLKRTSYKRFSKTLLKAYIIKRIPFVIKRRISDNSLQLAATNMNEQYSQRNKSNPQNTILEAREAKFEQFIANFINLPFTFLQAFKCAICLQIMISPALTACGHTFCWQCIEQTLGYFSCCPCCHQNLNCAEFILCRGYDKFIKSKIALNKKEQSQYSNRLLKFELWLDYRILHSERLQSNTLIDVKDAYGRWRQGSILKIYNKSSNLKNGRVISSVLIRYQRKDILYDQIISINSFRLAPLNCFTEPDEIQGCNTRRRERNIFLSRSLGLYRIRVQQLPLLSNFLRAVPNVEDFNLQENVSQIINDHENYENQEGDGEQQRSRSHQRWIQDENQYIFQTPRVLPSFDHLLDPDDQSHAIPSQNNQVVDDNR